MKSELESIVMASQKAWRSIYANSDVYFTIYHPPVSSEDGVDIFDSARTLNMKVVIASNILTLTV